jgi:flagellar biosynthesis protein FliP
MKNLLLLSFFRLGLILMALFLLVLVALYFLEIGFAISHGPSNFVFAVLSTVFFIPMIFLSFYGAAFFNVKIGEHKKYSVHTFEK